MPAIPMKDGLGVTVLRRKYSDRLPKRVGQKQQRGGPPLSPALHDALMASTASSQASGQHIHSVDHKEDEQARKRLREDDAQSRASTEDNEEMDQAAFTVVSYKKKRAAGVPVIFKPTQPNRSFWKVNPNLLASAVVTTAQEKVLSHRLNKDGSLMVTMSSVPAANRLLAVTDLAGIAVEARVPYSYSATYGRIQDVPVEYSDDDLKEYLSEQGVISAKRQVAYIPNEDGVVTETRRRSVILEFSKDAPLPSRVSFGFCSYPVTEYIGSATQCFRCQRHGHIAKYCNGPIRCKICAGAHTHKECTSRSQPRCANCGADHAASYGGCPKKKAATLARTMEQFQGKARKRREPPPNPDVIFTSTNQKQQEQQIQRSDTTSKKSFASVVKGNQKRPSSAKSQEKSSSDPDASQQQMSPKSQQNRKSQEKLLGGSTIQDISSMLIPMMFAAIKALLCANPSLKDIPEVQAVLAFEPLVTTSPTAQRRGSSE
ncbi:hypothetical protein HPB52_021165 [Rhipicephalus sanguineus]|uniref:CCHC-type domain-containing protein n=1 Tax=Rhipicephalus sanguineus TaxID=34632 RepID=A0A9D4QAS7_RHISA|nr:hypothetical protein HPB52_021165 [Rhipicephalus sanguineus]